MAENRFFFLFQMLCTSFCDTADHQIVVLGIFEYIQSYIEYVLCTGTQLYVCYVYIMYFLSCFLTLGTDGPTFFSVMFSYSHGLAAATAVTNVTSVDDYGCSVSSVRSARKTILWPQTIFIRLWDTISKLCLHHHQHQHPNGIQGNSTSAWTRTRAHKTSYKRLYKYTLYICSVTNVRFSIESFIYSISKMKGKKIEIKLNSFSMKSLRIIRSKPTKCYFSKEISHRLNVECDTCLLM